MEYDYCQDVIDWERKHKGEVYIGKPIKNLLRFERKHCEDD